MRILLDLDNVAYRIFTPWLKLHNDDYPDLQVTPDMFTDWDMSKFSPHLYGYLSNPLVYKGGEAEDGSQEVTRSWVDAGDEVGFVTAIVHANGATPKLEWLGECFPHVKNVIMTFGHVKTWIEGDVLIDDGEHNLRDFSGIRLLYTQPWNKKFNDYVRVNNWAEIHIIVQRIKTLLDIGYSHSEVEAILLDEQNNNTSHMNKAYEFVNGEK